MPKDLTVIQMNDLHGYYKNHMEMFIEKGKEVYRDVGGLSRISNYVNNLRQTNNNLLVFDNGDTFHGTYHVVDSKGEVLLPMLNRISFDAMTAHWDFAYGPAHLEFLVSQLNYPLLACNCFREGTDELVFPSHKIIEKNDIRIAVIGLAEHIVDKTMPSGFSEGVYFTLGDQEVRHLIDELNSEVDLIVLLSHLGFPQEYKLAQEIDGIDILLSGHTHNSLTEPTIVNGTLMIQSGCHGAHISQLDIQVEKKQIVSFQHQLLEVSEVMGEDPMIDEHIKAFESSANTDLEEIVGQTDHPLHRYRQLETSMDDFLLAAIKKATDTEIAFSNGWRYGAPIPAGPITMNDLWHIIPTNPKLSTVELTGQEIIDLLEDNLENTFSADPYQQMGGYMKRIAGLTLYIKIENPKGSRIQDIFLNQTLLERDKSYTVSFVTVQAVPKKYGKYRKTFSITAIEAMANLLKKQTPLKAKLHPTVFVV